MKEEKKRQPKKWITNLPGALLRICLILGVSAGLVFAATGTDTASDDKRLQNGSFEEGTWNNTYQQPNQNDVPSWNTTAYEGKIELFKENTGTYIAGVKLTPTDGKIAAELNADEESTLFQTVKTTPSSVYEWGLDHGARNGTDTMALVIGPAQYDESNQLVNPSKPSKTGRDQFMQMVDWLIDQGETSVKTSAGLGEQLTVYSKKFASNGTFADNAGNNAFSLTPSTIYTEEWHIWIMASSSEKSGTNPWNSYGANAEQSTKSENDPGVQSTDLENKYYHYTVPAGQTDTLFGFVSVGYVDSPTTADKAKTYGNFLDNINFQIYHPLSGSSTTHGSGVVGGSDGTTEGEGSSEGHEVTVDNNLKTYVKDGEPLKIQAKVTSQDELDGCEFVGIYYTVQDENGNPKTNFLQLAGNKIEDNENLTDEQKKGKWIKSTNDAGDIIYTYYLEGITSPTDLHFVFIKSPTVTYDPNGGKEYVVERIYNTDEDPNVYSFKPAVLTENLGESAEGEVDAVSGATPVDKPKELFISPYVSHAAEGRNDGWKFMGWLLTGDIVVDKNGNYVTEETNGLGTLVLSAVHTIACDYSVDGAAGQTAAQDFKIFNGNVSLSDIINKDDTVIKGVTWTPTGNETTVYKNVHRGLTMVAQWRWRQAFIPQVGSGTTYTESSEGGIVEITSVTNKSDENYDAAYNAYGGKSYHATTDEIITATATAKTGFTFEGWYDKDGKLLTTNTEYSYTETKESVNTYYARFSGNVTQNYIRQVKNGDTWVDTTDDSIGTLDRYTYTDAVGTTASSTATDGANYKFVGWYDSADNNATLVTKDTTLSYPTTGTVTYYARFETAYTVNFVAQTKKPGETTFANNTVGGTVSPSSGKNVDGGTVSSKATANGAYKFIGWYDKDGKQLSSDATYSPKTTPDTNGVTYYARFTWVYQIENQVYLSFVAESENVSIPSAFDGRNAGTGKNAKGYGLDNKYGNTIATGFKYTIADMTGVSTIQITVKVPNTAYVKVGSNSSFTGKGDSILSDSDGVAYNKGSIQQIKAATTLNYYWDASGLQANTTYGFIIDNLYAPGATSTITVNGKDGTQVTSTNGVVNTAATEYKNNSHYKK